MGKRTGYSTLGLCCCSYTRKSKSYPSEELDSTGKSYSTMKEAWKTVWKCFCWPIYTRKSKDYPDGLNKPESEEKKEEKGEERSGKDE